MNGSLIAIPWALAFVTALWFGCLAARSGKSWILWGLAGGLFGLVSSTFVFGLGHATAIPFSDQQRGALHTGWALAAAAIIVIVGGLFTWGMWRQEPQQSPPPQPQNPAATPKPGKNA